MPMQKYRERHASVRVCLCNSIVCIETSDISLDDCFAAFFCPNMEVFHPHKEQLKYIIF